MKTLNALLFSADEFAPMVEWARQHEEQFTVEMPAGLAFAPLSEIIYSPSILNGLAFSGVTPFCTWCKA